jgi:hypothetical protein
MFENGTLIIVDEFHKAFFHDVFIPTFQRDVDQMVATWNTWFTKFIQKMEGLFYLISCTSLSTS